MALAHVTSLSVSFVLDKTYLLQTSHEVGVVPLNERCERHDSMDVKIAALQQ